MSRIGIESQWETVLRSQSTSSDSKFLFHAESRQTLAIDTWNTSGLQENVFGNQFSTIDSSWNHHSTTPGDTGSVPVHIGVKTLVARDEDQNRSTMPMPTFARRPSSISSSFAVDIPHNSLVRQHRPCRYRNCNSINSLHRLHFLCWKIRLKNQVTTCSDFPSEAMLRVDS